MEIRFICFRGPSKSPAEIEFGSGLNLIYGPSNTGKSSILDGIDFMLGRESSLKELPEHEGYSQIYLGVEFSNSECFTFVRSIDGGDFECFEGLHKEKPKNIEAEILRPKKHTQKINSISKFILERISLSEKKLKANANNKLVNLTLRSSLDLAIVNEASIQEEQSPYISKQYTKVTEHKSRLKFFLTGVDDSSLLPSEVEKKTLSRTAKIEVLKELIDEQAKLIGENKSFETLLRELKEQDEKLSTTISGAKLALDLNEEKFNELIILRSNLRKSIDVNNDRKNDISEMLSRFELLEKQYTSDMSRLDNICETGTLLHALPTDDCPTCGQKVSKEDVHLGCDLEINNIVSAANSEKLKITCLHDELYRTITSLHVEKEFITNEINYSETRLSKVLNNLKIVNPELDEQRNRYSDLFSKKSEIYKSIEQLEQIILLNNKKEELEKDTPRKESSKNSSSERTLPTSALFKLSQSVKQLLQDWGLPNSNDVHFDKEKGDFVINGKHRSSNGKGHRAITHAAASLGLMKYADDCSLPYFGFSILDSPLLAYEEPDNEDDDLTGTDVNIKFFDSLSIWKSRQVIVFENKKSIPDKYSAGNQITEFTKNSFGRYGFFPL